MQQERLEAEQPMSAETLQAISEVFASQRDLEDAQRMSPEDSKMWMMRMDVLVDDIESRNRELTDAEKQKKELGLRMKVAEGIHELAESIKAAENLTIESVLDTRKAPKEFEQIGLKMRMDVARDSVASYEVLSSQVHKLVVFGTHLPEGNRKQLLEMYGKLQGLIRHEQKIAALAEKNFIDNLDARLAKIKREAA